MKKLHLLVAFTALALPAAAQARDPIRSVGSSTGYPFAAVIESTGSGGGFKLFCAGVGVGHPDITDASRRIKPSEVDQCAANGVSEITDVKIGYDGIVNDSKRAAHESFTAPCTWRRSRPGVAGPG